MGMDLEDIPGKYSCGTESIVVTYEKKQNNVYSVQGWFIIRFMNFFYKMSLFSYEKQN